MSELNPQKLHVTFKENVNPNLLSLPRKYTLTHSDSTGDLFLAIGTDFDHKQISGRYTRFMRDEVLAEWLIVNENYELHLYMHVSGGFCFGWAGLRDKIFRYHLPLVLEVFREGDKSLFEKMPDLRNSEILVHFQSTKKKYDRVENCGKIIDIPCFES